MCNFSVYVVFKRPTDGKTDIKHDKDETLQLKVTVEIELRSFLPREDRIWKALKVLKLFVIILKQKSHLELSVHVVTTQFVQQVLLHRIQLETGAL